MKTFLRFLVFTAALFTVFAIPLFSQDDLQDIDESLLLLDGNGEEAAGEESGNGEEEDRQQERLSTFTFWDFLRMVLILGAVIGLIYVIFYFIKKRGSPRFQDNELFAIISTQPISNNRTLHLVQVGNQYFLVGSAEQSVNLISKIEDQETIDEIRLKMSSLKVAQKKSFRNIFSGLFGQNAVRLDGSVNYGFGTDFLRRQKDKLKRM